MPCVQKSGHLLFPTAFSAISRNVVVGCDKAAKNWGMDYKRIIKMATHYHVILVEIEMKASMESAKDNANLNSTSGSR